MTGPLVESKIVAERKCDIRSLSGMVAGSCTLELVIGIGVENGWDRATALVSEWR